MPHTSNSLRTHARRLAQLRGISYTQALHQFRSTPTAIIETTPEPLVWQPASLVEQNRQPGLVIFGGAGAGKTYLSRDILHQVRHAEPSIVQLRAWSEYDMDPDDETTPLHTQAANLIHGPRGSVVFVEGDVIGQAAWVRLLSIARSAEIYPVVCTQRPPQSALVACTPILAAYGNSPSWTPRLAANIHNLLTIGDASH